jgi:hypothetical protein
MELEGEVGAGPDDSDPQSAGDFAAAGLEDGGMLATWLDALGDLADRGLGLFETDEPEADTCPIDDEETLGASTGGSSFESGGSDNEPIDEWGPVEPPQDWPYQDEEDVAEMIGDAADAAAKATGNNEVPRLPPPPQI